MCSVNDVPVYNLFTNRIHHKLTSVDQLSPKQLSFFNQSLSVMLNFQKQIIQITTSPVLHFKYQCFLEYLDFCHFTEEISPFSEQLV